MSVVSDTVVYPIGGATQVRLTVQIGDAQAGGTSVMYDGGSHDIPGDGSQVFGDGTASLASKILHCVTNVKDVNPATNRTSVSYTLQGGPADATFPYETTVPSAGEWAQYVVDIVLF